MKLFKAIMIVFSLVSTTSLFANSSLPSEQSRLGLHGMLLFSDGHALYASHLPMFHSPHDVQFIASIEITDSTTQAYLVDILSKGNDYWTLSPERFDLNLLGENGPHAIHQFRADLFAGHFEREGQLVFSAKTVRVKSIILKQDLDSSLPLSTDFIRVTPDNANRHFYARIIQGRPGVDQLFWLKSPAKLPSGISINSKSLNITADDIAKALNQDSNTVHLYYEEYGDLR